MVTFTPTGVWAPLPGVSAKWCQRLGATPYVLRIVQQTGAFREGQPMRERVRFDICHEDGTTVVSGMSTLDMGDDLLAQALTSVGALLETAVPVTRLVELEIACRAEKAAHEAAS